MNETHTIFGAGQVGTLLARHLAAQGRAVRLIRRSAPGDVIEGVTWMQGDANDAAFVDEACAGATVVYNCTNPSDYTRWEGVAALYRSIWRGAARAEARLVQLDNLYMYGRPEALPFDERTPERPCSQKGELRKALADELLEMHRSGQLEAVIGRGSDFFGPDAPSTVVSRPEVLDAIREGGTVYVFGDPDQPHGYTFIPDAVRGLASLGTRAAAPGRVWHLPTSSTGTTRELIDRMAAAAGTRVTTRGIPSWMLKTVGVFSSMMRAFGEMAYQFEIPYVLDDGDFRRTFGVEPTPLGEAVAITLGLRGAKRAA